MELLSLIVNSKENKSAKNLLNMFYNIMGIPVKIVDNYGKIVNETIWVEKENNPCEFIQRNENLALLCHKSCKTSYYEALRWGNTYISACHSGFYQMSVPILNNDEVIGGLIGFPFLMRNPTDQLIINLIQKNEFSSLEREHFIESIKNVPVVTEKRVKLASELLFSIADFFSIPDLGPLLVRNQQNYQQAQLAEEIQYFKNNHSTEHHLLPILNPKKEQELISKVRIGDKIGAKTILNEFLGQVMLHNPINIELLKAYVLELVIILTRTVVQEGANPESILGLRYQFVTDLSDISDHESLCFWVVKVMESICDNIYQTRNNHHYRILEQACTYIKENYTKKLTLETVAKKIYISPFYLCHLFKEELHITFIDYLTKIRIEAAKKLMFDTDMALAQIALEVGYPDQSYFTKVFKKMEQVTPKIYRRMQTSII